jgi:hypothetical protein
VLLVIVGLFDLANPENQAGEWVEGVLGVLVFISPWVLGFSGLAERNQQTMAAQH